MSCCLAVALLASINLDNLESRPSAPVTLQKQAPVSFRLFKREYPQADRTTYWLDVTCEPSNQIVLAGCELRTDELALGRFPLRELSTANKGRRLRFGVQCLSNQLIARSRFRLQVTDRKTGKGVWSTHIALTDAVAVKGMFSLDEAPGK